MSAEYEFVPDPRVLVVLPPLLGSTQAADLIAARAGDVAGRTVVVNQDYVHLVSPEFTDRFLLRLLKNGAAEIVFAGCFEATTPVVAASIERLGVGDRVRIGERAEMVGLHRQFAAYLRT